MPTTTTSPEVKYDAFVSYASEDRDVALEIGHGLMANGISVWLDRFILKVGDNVVDVINQGLNSSRTGIVIVSHASLGKNWPEYELRILVTDEINGRKRLLPVWHEVSEDDVRQHHPGLATIFALKTQDGLENIIGQLVESLAGGASTIALAPSWEDPVHRFLDGKAEAKVRGGGVAFTIWEAVLDGDDAFFPVWLGGRAYTRDDFLSEILMFRSGDPLAATHFGVKRETIERLGDLLFEKGLIDQRSDWPSQ